MKMINEETNKNEKYFLNENIYISVLFWFFAPLTTGISELSTLSYMLIKVMFCFSIRFEDTSSVEVNINAKTFFFKKTKEMKRTMIDLNKNKNETKKITMEF